MADVLLTHKSFCESFIKKLSFHLDELSKNIADKDKAWNEKQINNGFSEEDINEHILKFDHINKVNTGKWLEDYAKYAISRGAFCTDIGTPPTKVPYLDYLDYDLIK